MAEEHVAEVEETPAPAQEAVEQAPFEGEFDAERARRTIDNLRSREKELEQQLRSDEWFNEQLAARGYSIPDEDEDHEPEYDDEGDPVVARLTALEQAEQDRAEQAALGEQSDHIDSLAEQAGVKLTPAMKRWISFDSIHNGFTRKATEDAFQALKEDLESYGKSEVEKYVKSKRAPSPPPAGTDGQPGDFDPKDEKSRIARMAAVLARDSE